VLNNANSQYGFETYHEGSIFYKSNSPVNENFTIDFQKIFYNTPTRVQADSLFTFQRYNYFKQPTSSQAAAVISYTDQNGFTWSTVGGGNQTGSYVNITYSFEEGGTGYRYTVKGNFYCLLYNTSSPTQYKNITNAS